MENNWKWVGVTKQGKTITEETTEWEDVKENIQDLMFRDSLTNQYIRLPKNADSFIQGKTASCSLNGKVEIESRFIGLKKGNILFRIRVNNNNYISVECEEIES